MTVLRLLSVWHCRANMRLVLSLLLVFTSWRCADAEPPRDVPATSAETTALLDLRELPQLGNVRALQSLPTYVYSSAKASVPGATAFYTEELTARGWVPAEVPADEVPAYRDRKFMRDRFLLRMTVGESGNEGEVGISLSHLGNVDMSTLPRMGERDPNPLSTLGNLNYSVPDSILAVTKFCRTEFARLGWHAYQDYHVDLPEVPHVKQLSFCQNGVRVMVSIVRDPRNPNQKDTMVAYMAHHVMPYDLPVLADATDLRISETTDQAKYGVPRPVQEVVQAVSARAAELGWQDRTDEAAASAAGSALYFQDQAGRGWKVVVSDSGGSSLVEFESYTIPTSPPPVESNLVTAIPSPRSLPNDDFIPSPADDFSEKLQQEIQGTVRRQLQEVEGELKKLGTDLPQGLLDGLLKGIADDDASEPPAETEPSTTEDSDSFDVDDESQQAALRDDSQQLAQLPRIPSLCTVKYGAETYELKHTLAFRDPEDGEPIVMFCQEPLRAERAQQMLRKKEAPSVIDLIGNRFPPAIEIRLGDGYLSMSCFVDGASINRTSSDYKSEYLLSPSRFRGTVATTEVEEVFDKPFEFSASFDLGWMEVSSNSDTPSGLTASPDYDLPVPDSHAGISQQKTKYRTSLTAEVPAPVKQVLEFYQREFPVRGWKVDASQSQFDGDPVRGAWRGPEGTAEVVLRPADGGDGTQVEVVVRNVQLATQQGVVPAAGQGKMLLANATNADVVIQVGKRPVNVPAGKGARNPGDAVQVPVLPGKHRVTVSVAGDTQTEQMQIDVGATWGVIVLPTGGLLVDQVF